MRYKSLFVSTLILIATQACKHEIIIEQDPGNMNQGGVTSKICNPDTVYFQRDIQPLIVSSCAMPGCHDAITAEEDVILDSYKTIKKEVDPGNPNNSDLYTSLFDNDDIMPPPPYPLFTDEQKALVRTWILQGALNNNCDNGECLTDGLTYNSHIKTLVDKHCTGCHSTINTQGGLLLETYEQVKISIQSEAFMNTTNHISGLSPMPPGYKISDCEIDQLNQWITDGMPQ